MTIPNTNEWRSLFDKFKEKTELWQSSSEHYKNKFLKMKAWKELLVEYQKIEADATVEQLKRKIINIRTCYRRERKKVNASEKSGAGFDDIYIPSLWYFDKLDFLNDQEIPVAGTSSMDSDTEISISSEFAAEHHKGRPITRDQFLRRPVEYLETTKPSSSNLERDEATIFSEGWACSFRKLNVEQQMFAKKLFDETLLLGQLNKLSLSNTVSTPETLFSCPSARSETSYSHISSRSSTPLQYTDRTHTPRQPRLFLSDDSNTLTALPTQISCSSTMSATPFIQTFSKLSTPLNFEHQIHTARQPRSFVLSADSMILSTGEIKNGSYQNPHDLLNDDQFS